MLGPYSDLDVVSSAVWSTNLWARVLGFNAPDLGESSFHSRIRERHLWATAAPYCSIAATFSGTLLV